MDANAFTFRRFGAWIDIGIGAGIGAALLGRTGHVVLGWDYFAAALDEAWRLDAGGIDWHGALWGAVIGAWIAVGIRARLEAEKQRKAERSGNTENAATQRKTEKSARMSVAPSFARVLAVCAPLVPVIAFGAWYGCLAAGCGYGAEVATLADYPPGIVAELPDVYGIRAPRWNTPLIGMIGAAGVLAWIGIRRWRRGRMKKSVGTNGEGAGARDFWLAVLLMGVLMVGLGTVRGDSVTMVRGLRLDAVLDMATIAFAAARMRWTTKSSS
jgi:prolipoprotein diacylglyceryltransferase